MTTDAAPAQPQVDPQSTGPQPMPAGESQGRGPAVMVNRRLRRRLILFSLPVVIVIFAIAVKLIAMTILGALAAAAYARDDFSQAANLSRAQTVLNIIDPWKPHYNTGTALARQGLLDNARSELERALELAAPDQQCPVRVNLALTIEMQGDAVVAASGKTPPAIDLYQQALAVIQGSDQSCFNPPPPGQPETADPLTESEQRVKAKLDDQQQDRGDNSENPPPPDGGATDSQIDALEQQLEEAAKERSDQDAADRAHQLDSSQPGKPW